MKTRGFTLVELLVTMGIAGTLAAALIVSLLIGRNTYISSSASIDVQQEARRAFQTMVSELRESGSAAAPSITVRANTPAAGYNQVDFQIARSYNNAIVWGSDVADAEWVHYYAGGTNNSQLLRCRTATQAEGDNLGASNTCTNSKRVLGNDLKTFTASYAVGPPKTVTISLEIRKTSNQLPGGSMSSGTLQTTVELRNP